MEEYLNEQGSGFPKPIQRQWKQWLTCHFKNGRPQFNFLLSRMGFEPTHIFKLPLIIHLVGAWPAPSIAE